MDKQNINESDQLELPLKIEVKITDNMSWFEAFVVGIGIYIMTLTILWLVGLTGLKWFIISGVHSSLWILWIHEDANGNWLV